jgi:hypothetical protein
MTSDRVVFGVPWVSVRLELPVEWALVCARVEVQLAGGEDVVAVVETVLGDGRPVLNPWTLEHVDRMLRGEVLDELPSRARDWELVGEDTWSAVRLVGDRLYLAEGNVYDLEEAGGTPEVRQAEPGVLDAGGAEVLWHWAPVAEWERAWDVAREWARGLPARTTWDVRVDLRSDDFALARAAGRIGRAGLESVAGLSYERDGGVVSWAVLRVEAETAEAAERAVLGEVDRALAGVVAERAVRVEPTARIEPLAQREDPMSFVEIVLPDTWGTWSASDDGREITVRWLGGSNNRFDRLTVAEAADRVAIGLHQAYLSMLDERGEHRAFTLEGRGRRATVRLAAPLGDRVVVDALTGERRPRG